jgi:hypothetical protein
MQYLEPDGRTLLVDVPAFFLGQTEDRGEPKI